MLSDARGTRAARELRTTVLAALSHEGFRALVGEVYSVGPAPRSAEALAQRTGGAWRRPGRGAFVLEPTDPPPLETDEEPDPSALGPGPGEAVAALIDVIYGATPGAPSDRRADGPRTYDPHDRHDGQVSRPATRMHDVSSTWQCPEALDHRAGADGRCEWCHQRVAHAVPRPELGSDYHTILGDAYRYHYEPDWGSERDDY